MRTYGTLVLHNLKNLILKEPLYSVAFFVIPIIISILLSGFVSSQLAFCTVGIVDEDQSEISQEMIHILESYDELSVIEVEAYKGEQGLMSGDLDVVITLPVDFDRTSIEIRSSNENFTELLEGIIQTEWTAIEGPQIEINDYNLQGTEVDYSSSLSILSFIIMFLFLRASNGTMLITNDKDDNVYMRILVSRANKFTYYLANFTSTFLLLFAQSFLTIFVLQYLFNIQFGVSFGHLVLIFGVLSLFLVATVIFLEVFVRNKEVLNIANTFVMILLLLIGGGLVPIYYMPEHLNTISKLTPVRWAIDAIDKLQNGLAFASIRMNLVLIILVSVLLFGVAVIRETRRDSIS